MPKTKMAMHNDPMQRKQKYESKSAVYGSGHHEGRMAQQATGNRQQATG
jgi:hypothetical protein